MESFTKYLSFTINQKGFLSSSFAVVMQAKQLELAFKSHAIEELFISTIRSTSCQYLFEVSFKLLVIGMELHRVMCLYS